MTYFLKNYDGVLGKISVEEKGYIESPAYLEKN